MLDAPTIEDLQEVAMEHCEVLHECGFIKPVKCISTDDRCSMVQVLTLQFVLLQCKAELDQFIEGIKVWEYLIQSGSITVS